jgi:hypothetical protein
MANQERRMYVRTLMNTFIVSRKKAFPAVQRRYVQEHMLEMREDKIDNVHL